MIYQLGQHAVGITVAKSAFEVHAHGLNFALVVYQKVLRATGVGVELLLAAGDFDGGLI